MRLLFALTLCTPWLSFAEPITAIADNGREIVLEKDGTWRYASDDLFATTQDGRRIKLSPDGQWQPASHAEAPTYQPAVISANNRDKVYVEDLGSSITLDQLVIETHKETIGKNTRKRSNLVFYLDTNGTDLNLVASSLHIEDSKGRAYPVISINKGTGLAQQPRLIIRAKGAPRWWGVKFFSLQITQNSLGKNGLGNEQTIELRKAMSDVLNKDVSSLPED